MGEGLSLGKPNGVLSPLRYYATVNILLWSKLQGKILFEKKQDDRNCIHSIQLNIFYRAKYYTHTYKCVNSKFFERYTKN